MRFTLYHRRGCHLCEEMLDALERLCHGRGAEIELVDIDTDAGLSAAYGAEIPVLLLDGKELCRHRLDEQKVRERF